MNVKEIAKAQALLIKTAIPAIEKAREILLSQGQQTIGEEIEIAENVIRDNADALRIILAHYSAKGGR
jgi:hypothetical protein